jgi:hypothetical protein
MIVPEVNSHTGPSDHDYAKLRDHLITTVTQDFDATDLSQEKRKQAKYLPF